jgi:hypothetical protein
MHEPGTSVGLFPTRLHVDDSSVDVSFTLFNDSGSVAGRGLFRSLDAVSLRGVLDQQIKAVRIEAWTSIPAASSDARLVTVTDPPSVSSVQRIRLFVAGIKIGEWDANFVNDIPSFQLDGTWA